MGESKDHAEEESPIPFLKVLLADVDEADDRLKSGGHAVESPGARQDIFLAG